MIDWFDLPKLTTFTTEDHSFYALTSLCLSSMMIDNCLIDLIFQNLLHSLQDLNHSIQQQVWVCQVWWLIDWLIWSSSTLDTISRPGLFFTYKQCYSIEYPSYLLSDVPFSSRQYFVVLHDNKNNVTFCRITSSIITLYSVLFRFRNCIINKGCEWFLSVLSVCWD